MRLQGQRGMRIVDLTCVDSQAATWASCANTFEGTIVAWTRENELKASGAPPPPPPNIPGIFFTHSEPQVFLRTHIDDSARSATLTPMFVSLSTGGPLSTLNTISGIEDVGESLSFASTNNISALQQPFILLRAGDVQVFTDETGDAFGSGPGAVLAATFVNASGVDPLVGAYAAGQCTTGVYAKNRTWAHVSASKLPNGRTVAVQAGLPMLCTGSRLRFVALTVGLRSSDWNSHYLPPVEIGATRTSRNGVVRRTNVFPVLLPINEASMHPIDGGFSIRFEPAFGRDTKHVEINLSPSIISSDGLNFRLAGLPSVARFGTRQKSTLVQDGTSATCLNQVTQACSSSGSSRPLLCACFMRDRVGEVAVRFQTSRTPRNVGLVTNNGGVFGIYDYGSLLIDVG